MAKRHVKGVICCECERKKFVKEEVGVLRCEFCGNFQQDPEYATSRHPILHHEDALAQQ